MDTNQARRIKLLSYNVQIGIPTKRYRHYLTHGWKHFLPFPERIKTLDSIADFVTDFDIVGLTEMDGGSIRSEFINQPEYVAKRAGFPYCYSRLNRDFGIFAKHSLAVLSRWEAHIVRDHSLPSAIPGRGALELHFLTSDKEPLIVVLAHLSLSGRARAKQLQYISNIISDCRHAVVMGDLNSEVHSTEMNALLNTTTLTRPEKLHRTYPSWRPRLGYDHILVTPEIKLGEAEVFAVKHSDHLPVGREIGVPAVNGNCARKLPAT